MVYNGTSIGMNTSLWYPYFLLPMFGSTLHAAEKGNFMADWYIGYMFLNFMLSEKSRQFCGVDVTNIRTEEDWDKNILVGWEIW